jgi:hypothetical protein
MNKEFYLVYFGETIRVDFVKIKSGSIETMTDSFDYEKEEVFQFNSFGMGDSRICICIVKPSIETGYESSCRYCEDLDYPVFFDGNGDSWYEESGKRIGIKLDGQRYIFSNISESQADVDNSNSNVLPSGSTGYQLGYQAALDYQAGKIKDYEIVLQMSTSSSARQEFIEGFKRAYVDAGESEKAEEFSDLLDGAYPYIEAGERIGFLHGTDDIMDDAVQNAIKNSVMGTTRSHALGWKAGYVRGFATTYDGEGDDPMREGVAMYDALRAVFGII